LVFGVVACAFSAGRAHTQAPSSGTSASSSPYPFDLRIGLISSSVHRNFTVDPSPAISTQNASLHGYEGTLSTAEGEAGIGGRSLQGSFGGRPMLLREGKLFVGAREFEIEGAYVQRRQAGRDSTDTFARAGLRSINRIGGSGVSVMLAGSAYIPIPKHDTGSATPSRSLRGWEGESAIYYTWDRLPIYLHLGYRFEYFAARTESEEMSGLNIGLVRGWADDDGQP
jgi:hypothetical protein